MDKNIIFYKEVRNIEDNMTATYCMADLSQPQTIEGCAGDYHVYPTKSCSLEINEKTTPATICVYLDDQDDVCDTNVLDRLHNEEFHINFEDVIMDLNYITEEEYKNARQFCEDYRENLEALNNGVLTALNLK